MTIDLQEQLPGESKEEYKAYTLRRDNTDLPFDRWYKEVYQEFFPGDKRRLPKIDLVRGWVEKFKWAERILDYDRPVSTRVSEVIHRKRSQESTKVAERIVDDLLLLQSEAEQVLMGNSTAMSHQAAARVIHDNIPHIERVFKLDFDFIEDKSDVLHHSPVIGQIWDIIQHKIPDNRNEFLICPIKDNLKTTQSEMVMKFLISTEGEILASGPVNCGKTIICLLYIIALHCAIPGFQSMIIRTEAKSIYNTILPQLFNKILKLAPKDPRQPFTLYGGDKRPLEINWKNGGTTFFAGFDNSEKIRGTEMDLVFHSQLEREPDEASYLDLIGRIEGGRGGNWFLDTGLGFGQIIGDANPGSPYHWLKAREKNKQLEFFNFGHDDNPHLFYNFTQTPDGINTVEGLKKRYVGYMLERMVFGLWVGASGLVYPMFNESDHVKPLELSDIPDGYKWFLSNDYGGQAPFCYQLWAVSPERDQFIMFREIYHTKWILDEQIAMVKNSLLAGIDTKTLIAEHNFEHNLRFEKEKFNIILADKEKAPGLEQCKTWLSKPGAVIFNSNALVHPPDPDLLDQPHSTIQEFRSYSYKEEGTLTGHRSDEEPVPKWNHGMDAFRYLINSLMKVNYIPDFSGSTYKVKKEHQHVF